MKLGLIGKKLGHSLSPEIHEYLMKQQGIEGSYKLIEVPEEETSGILPMMRAEGFTGLNVTIPYKEMLLPAVDVLSEDVKNIGALNTILLINGKTYAYNTDHIGVSYMFEREGVVLKGADITLLGAGGAAKAAIYAFYKAGAASVTVAVRSPEKAEGLKKNFRSLKSVRWMKSKTETFYLTQHRSECFRTPGRAWSARRLSADSVWRRTWCTIRL